MEKITSQKASLVDICSFFLACRGAEQFIVAGGEKQNSNDVSYTYVCAVPLLCNLMNIQSPLWQYFAVFEERET